MIEAVVGVVGTLPSASSSRDKSPIGLGPPLGPTSHPALAMPYRAAMLTRVPVPQRSPHVRRAPDRDEASGMTGEQSRLLARTSGTP